MRRTLTEANPLVRWARMPALLAACYGILVTAVLFGMTTLGGTLPRLISPAELGLGTNRVGIEPLTDRFIEQVLGPGAVNSGPALERIGLRGRRGGGPADDGRGQVVQHELTNDDRGDAYPVSRLPFTARSTTTDAGREPGEPACGPQVGGGTVWYRYRAVADQRLLADTFTSNYQTSLAGYRVNGDVLTQLACDTDAAGNAQIAFPALAGTTYLFQIGAAVRGGDLVFHLDHFGTISLASISSEGLQGDEWSFEPSVSYDGRYVAFTSYSVNLTRDDVRAPTCLPWDLQGPCPGIFLRDRLTATTRLVSVTVDGRPTDHESLYPHVSDDGRYVAFTSSASNLVEGDTNGVRDIFVRDMITGHTERASVTFTGEQTAVGSGSAAMSGDGRYVAFDSGAQDLNRQDTTRNWDVFVRDRVSGVTSLACLDHRDRPIPISTTLVSSGSSCSLAGISRNGRWVVFYTSFPMTADDHDDASDVFVRDLHLGTTHRISGAPGGQAPNNSVVAAGRVPLRSISDDGRFVVFGSNASNLVAGDTNAATDVFVHDRGTGRTERVSVSSSGAQGIGVQARGLQGGTGLPSWSISGDGRYVAFASRLAALVSDDFDRANDVFLHDRSTKTTLRPSVASGEPENGIVVDARVSDNHSDSPRISGDGRTVAFDSELKLTDDDTNGDGVGDVFVYQRRHTT